MNEGFVIPTVHFSCTNLEKGVFSTITIILQRFDRPVSVATNVESEEIICKHQVN